jgi:hypothetical protein
MAHVSPQFRTERTGSATVRVVSAVPRQPTGLLIALATGPVLVGLVGLRVVGGLVQQLSLQSEELLRGDRLPPIEP